MDTNQKVPDFLKEKCRQFARQVVAAYANGDLEASRALSFGGAEKNEDLWTESKEGECAFCLFAGLDPIKDLHWDTTRADDGYDVIWQGIRWDVKTIALNYRYLIWSVNKRRNFQRANFDRFALVKFHPDNCVVYGWIKKQDFFERKEIAKPSSRLHPGTWYVDQSLLERLWPCTTTTTTDLTAPAA